MNTNRKTEALTEAQRRLEHATLDMPVLGAIAGKFAADTPLKGHRIALCGHITEATSVQVRTLTALGADVAWCASSTTTTDDDVGAVMRDEVSLVVGTRGMSDDDLCKGVEQVLDYWDDGPTIVLDEGARLICALHEDAAKRQRVCIAAEKTPEGISVIKRLDIAIPVLMSDMSIGKRLVDNPHGTSQSLLHTILSITHGLLAGKTLLVCGYGRVGCGVAQKARGLGARVLVSEVRPTRALMAVLNGFEVLPIKSALPQADIVITVTGQVSVIGPEVFDQFLDGVILVNGGHLPVEIDTVALADAAVCEDIATGLERYTFPNNKSVFLMAGGHIANLSVGTGNPNSVMDTTFASQVLGLVNSVNTELSPGLHALPNESEQTVARLIAESLGVDVSSLDQSSGSHP